MNYLQLCQRLRSEAGLSGTGPTTVIDQTGEMLRVVQWIDAAYETILNYHATWRFLRDDFSGPTVASTSEYSPADMGITDFASWVKSDMRLYSALADETFLYYTTWPNFKIAYLHATNRTLEERPIAVSVKPNEELRLWPIPDAVYTVDGEYYKTGDAMTVDADIPVFPARFHMIIVWRALMLYGAFAAADEKYAHGESEYGTIMRQLEQDQLETITYGAPLA